jgi:hypothetical protein
VSRLIRKRGVSARCFTVARIMQDYHVCGGHFSCKRSSFIYVSCCIQTFKTVINQNLRRSFCFFFTLIRSLCSGGLSNSVNYTAGDGGFTFGVSRCLHSILTSVPPFLQPRSSLPPLPFSSSFGWLRNAPPPQRRVPKLLSSWLRPHNSMLQSLPFTYSVCNTLCMMYAVQPMAYQYVSLSTPHQSLL